MVQGSIRALTVTTYNLFSLGSTVDLARPRTNVHFFLHFFYFFLSRLPLGDHETPFSAPSNQLFLYTSKLTTTLEVEATTEIRELPEPWDGKDLFLLIVTGIGFVSLLVWSLNFWDGVQRDRNIKALQKVWRERNEARKREKENDEKNHG